MTSTREIALEKIKVGVMDYLSNQLLDLKVDFSESDSFIPNTIALQVSGFIWGENGKSETIRYPRTWKDAFKERWFPKWLLSKYPAVYQVHEISVRTLYPNFKISLPNETHVLKYQIREHSSKGWLPTDENL